MIDKTHLRETMLALSEAELDTRKNLALLDDF